MSAVTNKATSQQPTSPPANTAITQLVPLATPELTADEMAVKVVHKRYEGLVMVRTKAIKGKGAWYWAHLEPILVRNQDSGVPKAVKLRCCLCEALFSASNPSRTASEHLKRGTCPNFSSDSSPNPISSASPAGMVGLSSPATSSSGQPVQNHRKRNSSGNRRRSMFKVNSSETTYSVAPITMIEPPRFSVDVSYPIRPDSVPAFSAATVVAVSSGGLQSPHHHHHHQQQSHVMLSGGKDDLGALAMLEDSVKKLKSPRSSPGQTLSKAQIDSSLELLANWVYENCGSVSFSSLEHPKFKNFLNQIGLPAITRRDLAGERLDSKYSEAKAESEARIRDALFFQISSDGWKSKINRYSGDMENLVNLSVNLPNGTSVFRRGVFTGGYVFSKYAEDVLWETICDICGNNLEQCVGIVSDKFKSKALRNLENQHHWMLEAVHSLIRLIKDMAQEIEKEKPRIGQCLPLWEELRVKIREWCGKYHINENHVDKVFDKRFKRNYHPAWAAAFILDPFYLIRDISGRYLPPFKCLTSDQEKDVDKLITRLVSREEAHIALMELMKWRTEGLDSVYAQAVQLKQRDPITGKMKIANPQSSRLVWETYLTDFKSLRKVAVRLIFLHATSCGFKWNPSLCRWAQSRNGIDKVQKLIFIAAHSKLERRDCSNDEERDAELFSLASRENDVLNEVLFDASSL
ncbi:hypothetical protein E3N88_16712 [Mikania micrantha]|uniref:DUF7963 domain-containing protein n=1 Tax=Mikania micrantha TaxID=192012 RepID=A0A5N6NPT0_9ASTR|nr:hypothetical protein E3N88_16712 [Mikania micrantha]